MPGLFGVVRIDPRRPVTREFLESWLGRMAVRLHHYDGYVAESFFDDRAGLALGRIGFPHHHATAWPAADDPAPHRLRAFIAGRPHGEVVAGDSWDNSKARLHAASGSFSAVLHSAAGKKTVIIADRQGSQPVFYTAHEGLLLFAPEVKPLLEFLPDHTAFDLAALATYLASGYLLSEQTFFRAIRRLPGGAELAVADGRCVPAQYWRFRPGAQEHDRSLGDYAQEAGARIDAAVARELDDPDRTVLLLSGGVDSRAILGAAYHALRRDGRRLHAVTWGCAPGRAGADISIARQLAARLNIDHEVIQTELTGFTAYGDAFRRVNYLLDGMSEAAALHPDKFAITEQLYARGYRILLRGEQSFGFAEREYSAQGALAKLGLRRFRDNEVLRRVVRPDHWRALAEAADPIMDGLVEEAAALDPNDFTHRAYFHDRYQRLSGTAAYYKQALMDHRSPLMDNAILDLIEHLPKPCRDDKALLYHTVRWRYPELAGIDYASRTNLEDWNELLAADTPVRRYALAELSDTASGIWDLLDREAVRALLDQAVARRKEPLQRGPFASALRARAKSALYRVSPRLAATRRLAKAARRDVPAHQVLMRALVLKHWHDAFVRK